MLPAFLATVLFSLSVIFANRTTRALGGTTANFYRLCLSTGLLAIYAHGFGDGHAGDAFWIFFLSGVVGFGVSDMALYQAIPRLGPRLSILMVHCLAAPIAALMEWLWLGTGLSTIQILSGFTILTGVAIALAPGEHPHLAPRTLMIGILCGAVAAIGQGGGAVISRKAYGMLEAAGQLIDPLTATYQRVLGGLAFAGIPSLWIMRRHRVRVGTEPDLAKGSRVAGNVWVWVVLNTLAGPTLGVACYLWALQHNQSGLVLPIVATTPIVVIPFAYFLDGDRPRTRSVVGGLIAVAGAVVLARSR